MSEVTQQICEFEHFFQNQIIKKMCKIKKPFVA